VSKPALQDVGWELLRRAETHDSHSTVEMLAAVDRGPIFMWVCPMPKCGKHAHTYNAADPAPLCTGGFPWSFTTTDKFNDG
jgi:hypothetical protein